MIAARLDGARLDHVAVAVTDLDAALAYWCGTVGGGMVTREATPGFHAAQVRFAGGGKLELLAAPPEAPVGGFVARFLDRFGPTIHHVTLKVPDIGVAVDTVRAGGFDVVDVQATSPHWREGFLRPSQVGGLIVQVAWASETDRQWAARLGLTPHEPGRDAPRLDGVTIAHPDLSAARSLWSLLGAQIGHEGTHLVCRWADSPLDIVIERRSAPGPVGLRFTGALPAAPAHLGTPPVTRA